VLISLFYLMFIGPFIVLGFVNVERLAFEV
jgi:hypothetical protein